MRKSNNRAVRGLPCPRVLLRRKYGRLFHAMDRYMRRYCSALARDPARTEKVPKTRD